MLAEAGMRAPSYVNLDYPTVHIARPHAKPQLWETRGQFF
jgi:hypothetical protein